jgi:hypothetical protein
MGEAQYLKKFIENVLVVSTPLHAMASKGKIFHWGKPQQQVFEELKTKINNSLVLSMPNLKQPFELEIYASGYALRVVLSQGGRVPICYHLEFFHGELLDYPMYGKVIFYIV